MTQVITVVFLPFRTVWFLDKNSDLSVNVSVDEDFCSWGIMTLDLEFDPDLALRRREDVVGLMGLERLIFYHLYFSKMRHLWNFFPSEIELHFSKVTTRHLSPQKMNFPQRFCFTILWSRNDLQVLLALDLLSIKQRNMSKSWLLLTF